MENIWFDEPLISKVFQMIFQLLNLRWIYFVMRNHTMLGILKKIYSEIDILFREEL